MSSLKSTSSVGKPSVDAQESSEIIEKITEWKVLAKIDYRVVPVLCVLYVLAFLDR